jgi:hypothetical protein
LEEENKVIRAREANGTLSRKPSLSRQPLVTNDDEDSIVKPDPNKRAPVCAACGNNTSSTWWKAPKGLSTSVLCSFCGIAWRKYGDLTLRGGREEPSAPQKARPSVTEKREISPPSAPPAKKVKVG